MNQGLNTLAVVIEGPERLALDRLALQSPADDDIVVATEWSGISTGTERLLWSGKMPPFPEWAIRSFQATNPWVA